MVIHLRRDGKRFLLLVLLVLLVVGGIFAVRAATGYYYSHFYPRDYEEYITGSAAENAIDENMLFALVKTESGFQPDATSNVGARGLCQIMKDTFEWVRGKMGDDAVYDDMYNPDTNVRYGAFLLATLYREFGSYEVALAAYHAGRGAVAGWLADKSYSSDGKTLDHIPIDDTEHYVGKVMKAYSVYQRLYPPTE